MSYFLMSQQMREMDSRCINEFGIPARILMENAGKSVADLLVRDYQEYLNGMIIIVHGGGNNSGDGFVAARYLRMAGLDVALLKVHDSPMSTETKANYELCHNLDIRFFDFVKPEGKIVLDDILPFASMVIDAVFGIGFKGKLPGKVKDVYRAVNRYLSFHVAIDIPSGISADTGMGDEDSVFADLTFCMHAPKLGNLIHMGKQHSGKLVTVPIGIPPGYYEYLPLQMLITHDNCTYPQRYPTAHKGTYGRLFVIGGSLGFTGSVIMSALAGLRAGAGYVILLSRRDTEFYYSQLPPEIMYRTIPEYPDTEMPHTEALQFMLNDADGILVGPGLGLDSFAHAVLETVLTSGHKPIIIDADAITLISEDAKLRKHLKKRNILITPHYGEFARLINKPVSAIIDDTVSCLQAFVEKTKAKVLLKSDTTLFSDGKRLLLNNSGNDGLATGGSGDVLAGIIASFAMQGMDLGEAAINASHLMGATAQRLAKTRETPSILPTDIIHHLFEKKST